MRSRDYELGDLLQRFTFVVPDFQRPYSWSQEQLEEFWQDLLARTLDAETRHFVGTMVVQSTGADQVVVWDGQQRLATTVILLAAVRDYAHLVEDDQAALEIANDLHSRYIVPGGIFETARESIRLGATDRKTVAALVLRRIGEASKADLSYLTGLPSAVRKQDWSPSIIAAFDYFDRQLHLLLEVEGVRRTNWL